MDEGPVPNVRQKRRGRAAGLVALAVVLFAAGGLVGAGVARRKPEGHTHGTTAAAPAAPKTLYQCPMHPTITSDHPGDCPICGMKLVEVKGEAKAAAAAGTSAGKILF